MMQRPKSAQLAALAVVLSACSAATVDKPIEPPPPPPPSETVIVQPAAELDLGALDGARWQAVGDHGFQLSYRFDQDHYTTSGYPDWDESGRVALLRVDGRRLLLSFDERVFDGQPDERMERWIVLADDGESFEMDGMVFRKLPHAATVVGEAITAAQQP